MKALVQRLEDHKAQLLKAQGDQASQQQTAFRNAAKAEFVKITQQIEELRKENAAMSQEARDRDIFSSSLHTLLLEFQGDPPATAEPQMVGFTPLTVEEAELVAKQARQAVSNVRLDYVTRDPDADDALLISRGKVFGWSDYRARRGKTVTFVVSKVMALPDAISVMDKTWGVCTDEQKMKRILSPDIPCEFQVLQKISDDMLVVDRTTFAMPGLTLRTVYLLLREQQDDGGYLLIMKTINLPLAKQLLRPGEVWCDIFYWVRVAAVKTGIESEFGGVLTYTHEQLAARWIVELIFLAIRWENHCGVANMLTF